MILPDGPRAGALQKMYRSGMWIAWAGAAQNSAKVLTRIAAFTWLFNFRLSQSCAGELPGKMINPSIPSPSNCKSNRPVIDGSSLIDCLSCPIRGLSEWFNQVSTEGIKKSSGLQIVWRIFLPYILAKPERENRPTAAGFVLLSGADYNRVLFFDDPFSTIHAS